MKTLHRCHWTEETVLTQLCEFNGFKLRRELKPNRFILMDSKYNVIDETKDRKAQSLRDLLMRNF